MTKDYTATRAVMKFDRESRPAGIYRSMEVLAKYKKTRVQARVLFPVSSNLSVAAVIIVVILVVVVVTAGVQGAVGFWRLTEMVPTISIGFRCRVALAALIVLVIVCCSAGYDCP